jgi:hypothetical protein
MRAEADNEAEIGSLQTEGSGMLTQADLDSDPAADAKSKACTPQNSPCGSMGKCCQGLKCEPNSNICLPKETVKAMKEAERKKAAEERKQKAEAKKQKAADMKKKKAEAAAKRKEERERKAKERKAKRKAERDRKKKGKAKKGKKKQQKKKGEKNKLMLSCTRDPITHELKCHEMEKVGKDASPEEKLRRRKVRKLQNGKPQINFSDGDNGVWKTVAPNPWPPHNLNIKSFVLTGIGSTNIKCAKAEGGFGLPNPSPLVLKFPIGYDTHIHKLVEKHKDREEVSGVLYYVAGNGRAVGKLTFENAVIASIKWPKLDHTGPKSEKTAMITVILQPASSTVEKIEKVRDAPEAPHADSDKLHTVLRKDFKLEVEGFNNTDSGLVRVTLPSIVMNFKRKTKFGWDPETKRQKRSVTYKVTGIKHKHLFIRVAKAEVKSWRDWVTEPQKRPRIGSVEIMQTPEVNPEDAGDANAPAHQPLYTLRFYGLYPNRIIKGKDTADVELSFDKMSIEHHDPE